MLNWTDSTRTRITLKEVGLNGSEIKGAWHAAEMDAHYAIASERNTTPALLLQLSAFLRDLAGRAACWFHGEHKLEDASVAGPNHGTMAHHCVRCGWSFSVTLY